MPQSCEHVGHHVLYQKQEVQAVNSLLSGVYLLCLHVHIPRSICWTTYMQGKYERIIQEVYNRITCSPVFIDFLFHNYVGFKNALSSIQVSYYFNRNVARIINICHNIKTKIVLLLDRDTKIRKKVLHLNEFTA